MSSLISARAENSDYQNETDRRRTRRDEVARVVDQIEVLCEAFGVGARIPAHRSLSTRFATTERTVLNALAELQRRGRIVRRAGSGTYVAPKTAVATASNNDNAVSSIALMATLDDGYYSRAVDMAFKYAHDRNIQITVHPPNFERIPALVRADGRTGLLIVGSMPANRNVHLCDGFARTVGVGIRVVGEVLPFPRVTPDCMTGGYLAASHLIDLGHRNIAYFGAGSNPRSWGHDRAVRDRRDEGADVESTMIGSGTFSDWQRNPSFAEKVFSAADRPTGICAWNDSSAIALMTFLASIGLNVPKDISIVGYDNLPVTETITPALTTIDTHLEAQVKLAINVLASSTDLPSYSIIVDPELTLRASTAPR